MNVPEFGRAIDAAMREYQEACLDARDRMLKAFEVAKQEFLEDREMLKAVDTDDTVRVRR